MTSYKEIWIAAYEDGMAAAEDRGLTGKAADDFATEHAEGAWERLVDQADNLRKAAREG